MKVLYDFQVFSWQRYGGISRYFSELIRHGLQDPKIKIELAIKQSVNAYLDHQGVIPSKAPTLLSKIKNRISRKLRIPGSNYQYSRSLILKDEFDVFHPTYYEDYYLDILKKPLVITVHDMIHERMPELFPSQDGTPEVKRRVLARANHIIAISENTKKDLIELLGVSPEKITVIHHGHSIDTAQAAPLPRALKEKSLSYLLYVGERGKYKNFIPFIREIAGTLKSNSVSLVCFGGAEFNPSELSEFQALGIEHQMHHFSGSDSLLSSLYQNALCFCFPSKYEGFGLPILEAYGNHCPVILENASCFPEIADSAALYADTKTQGTWSAAIHQILSSDSARKDLIAKGNQRLENFSWEKTYQETKKVYQKTIDAFKKA